MTLFSYRWKIEGYILMICAGILTVLYFKFNFRFEMPVFAVVSAYKETRLFAVFSTNFADETIMLTFLSGLALIAFSKEKKELGIYKEIRIKALITTVKISTAILLFSILFIYGGAFMAVVVLNLFLPLVLYLIIFNVKRFTACRNPAAEKLQEAGSIGISNNLR